MSWFDECTLNYEDFEKIRLYLLLFKVLIEISKPNIFNAELLDDLITKLEAWLNPEEERKGSGIFLCWDLRAINRSLSRKGGYWKGTKRITERTWLSYFIFFLSKNQFYNDNTYNIANFLVLY